MGGAWRAAGRGLQRRRVVERGSTCAWGSLLQVWHVPTAGGEMCCGFLLAGPSPTSLADGGCIVPPLPWRTLLCADYVIPRQFNLPVTSKKAALIIEPRQHYGELPQAGAALPAMVVQRMRRPGSSLTCIAPAHHLQAQPGGALSACHAGTCCPFCPACPRSL